MQRPAPAERLEPASLGRLLDWLRARLAPDTGLYVALLICGCLFSVLDVAFALLMRGLINCAVAADTRGAVLYAALLLVTVVVRVVGGRLLSLADDRMGARLRIRVRAHMLDVVQTRRYADVQGYHSGELMNRLYGDTDTVCDALLELIPSVIMLFTGLLGAGAALALVSPWLPLVICVAGLAFFGGMRLFKGVIRRLYKQMREADDQAYTYHQELLSNLLVVRVFSSEKRAEQRAAMYEGRRYDTWNRWLKKTVLSEGAAMGFEQLGYLAALVVCAYGLMNGWLRYGDMAAVLQLVSKLQQPFAGLSGMIPRYCASVASLDRLRELEELPREAVGELTAAELAGFTELCAHDVRFGYEPTEPVLTGASFTIRRGDFVMLRGTSGAGKTTLIQLLLGVYAPDGGTLALCGDSLDRPLDAGTRGLFAYVPQGNLLFSGTVRENLCFLCGERTDAELAQALETSCAMDFVRELPDGLDTVLEEGGRGISEGQAQRLAVARALLSDKPVLLLDEATSALDERTEMRLLGNLRALGGKTILLVSHRQAALEVCDRVLTVSGGMIQEESVRKDG